MEKAAFLLPVMSRQPLGRLGNSVRVWKGRVPRVRVRVGNWVLHTSLWIDQPWRCPTKTLDWEAAQFHLFPLRPQFMRKKMRQRPAGAFSRLERLGEPALPSGSRTLTVQGLPSSLRELQSNLAVNESYC